MTNVIAIMFGILIIVAFAFFAGGAFVSSVKEKKAKQNEEARQKAERDYQEKKQEIFQEVFGDGEKKKAALSNAGDARARFNAINDSLRNDKGCGQGRSS